MKKFCVLLGAAICAAPLWGNAFFDCLTNIAHAAVRTNAHLLVNSQAAANSNNVAGTLLKSYADSGFSASGTLSNTLQRVLGTAAVAPAATTAAATTAVTAATNAAGTTATQPNRCLYPPRPQRSYYRRQPSRRSPVGY